MKKTFLSILFLVASLTAFAQDDCDPSSSMDDVWMGKRTEFGPNCMQYAINLSMNTNHNRGLALSDGTYIAVYSAERIESPFPGGEWKVLFQDSQGWGLTEEERLVVFRRPGSIKNLGPLINMEFYTLDLDTGIIKVDINDIMKKVRDDMDDYEDELEVTIEPVYEDGKLYAKITGNMMIGEGLKPTRAGDIIAYFYMSICYNINYNIKWTELEAVKKVPGMKLDYWNKSALAAAFKMRSYINEKANVKEGRFNWSENDGAKSVQIDNYGTYCLVYIQVKNTEASTRQKVVEELGKWVEKKKHKYADSMAIKMFGETPWLEIKFNLVGKKGSDIYDDYYEDVIDDWGNDFIDEAQDIIKDLK